jgi:oxygen-dependent protoporphyrinogen oxidase
MADRDGRARVRVTVVGGGIAGLAAAHRLVEVSRAAGRPLALTLLEASGRLGGNIRTEASGGFLLEAGPDSFVTDRPWALDLVRRLGLGPRLRYADPRWRRTYVVHRGRLHALPEGLLLMAPTRAWPILTSSLFSWPGKARLALDLALPRGGGDDESLARFVTRRLGRQALERVAAPLVAGIHAADPERLSVAAALPRFRALEREHRSLILGLRRGLRTRRPGGSATRPPAAGPAPPPLFATLAGGPGELVLALAGGLPAGSVRVGCPAAAVRPGAGGARWDVRLADGAGLPADGVVLAGEAHRMAPLVQGMDAGLGGSLAAIPYASSATVALAYPRAAIRHPLDAHGFVVATGERHRVRACTFTSVKYPGRAPDGAVLLRAYAGGARDPRLLERDDPALAGLAHADLADLLGITAPPLLTRVARHRAVLPQYEVGHLRRVAALEARVAAHPGLALVGAAYRGVGIADSVHAAEAAAARLWDTLTGT